jgi:hypothetical protein
MTLSGQLIRRLEQSAVVAARPADTRLILGAAERVPSAGRTSSSWMSTFCRFIHLYVHLDIKMDKST